MKKLYTSLFVLLGLIFFASPPTFAQSDTYIKTQNAAISGHNNKKLSNVTPQQCQTACSQERGFSCKSFDYDKENYACDLSDKRASDVGGLKRDYAGDQYDHYSLSPRLTSNPRPVPTNNNVTRSGRYIKTSNAAISGHNNKKLSNVTPQQCQTACSQERGFSCKSFDYDKENYACDLSDKRASDVGGLKRDYAGNPFDHYSLSPRFSPNPSPAVLTPPTSNTSSGSVTLYQHCNYEGYSVSLPVGSFDLSSLKSRGVKNDDISSIKVSPGYTVDIYKDAGYRGTKRTLEGNVSCLTSYGMNDQLSSVRVASRSFNSPRPTTTTRPTTTRPTTNPRPTSSNTARTGNLACVCTDDSCGRGAISGKAGDIFLKQSLYNARESFTVNSRTGWTCAVPNETSGSSGATGCYCKGYCGNGGRGADPKTLVLGVSQSSLNKFYGGGKKGNGTGWICGNIRN